MKEKLPVIAVFDIGKTNKKLLVFNTRYEVVAEESTSFPEQLDEDGFACEDLDRLTNWILQHVEELKQSGEFDLKAINFSTYGASVVYIDVTGKRISPLYNYLKPYPDQLMQQFTASYGSSDKIGVETSSPIMGHLNAGLQLYWLKYERPAVYEQLAAVLHFPQYLSFLLTGHIVAEMTNLGCHSAMWSFREKKYHPWLAEEGISNKLAGIARGNEATEIANDNGSVVVGVGLHDSSAAVIPYLASFRDPFVIVSTGTWTVSLNPFNRDMPGAGELAGGCLSYLTYEGDPVKASMLFAGHDHDKQLARICAQFEREPAYFRSLPYDAQLMGLVKSSTAEIPGTATIGLPTDPCIFHTRDLGLFESAGHAYHQLLADIIERQAKATRMVLVNSQVSKMFVDGGFCQNNIYMQLLADAFPEMEVYSTSMVQGTALGAALAIHDHWNTEPLPASLIRLKKWNHSTLNHPVG